MLDSHTRRAPICILVRTGLQAEGSLLHNSGQIALAHTCNVSRHTRGQSAEAFEAPSFRKSASEPRPMPTRDHMRERCTASPVLKPCAALCRGNAPEDSNISMDAPAGSCMTCQPTLRCRAPSPNDIQRIQHTGGDADWRQPSIISGPAGRYESRCRSTAERELS